MPTGWEVTLADPATVFALGQAAVSVIGAIEAFDYTFGSDSPTTGGLKTRDLDAVKASPGAGFWYYLGHRVRIPGVLGFSEKPDTDTIKVKQGSGKDDPAFKIAKYTSDLIWFFGRSISGVNGKGKVQRVKKVWGDEKGIYDDNPDKKDNFEHMWQEAFVREGGDSSSVIPWYPGKTKSGLVPAHRNVVSFAVEDLDLTNNFGERAPQFVDALIYPDDTSMGYTVQNAITDLWLFSPLGELDQFDVSGFTGDRILNDPESLFWGMKLEGPFNIREAIEEIVFIYDGYARLGRNGELQIRDRGTEDGVDVPLGQIAIKEGVDEIPTEEWAVRIRPKSQQDIPSQLIFDYYSANLSYRKDSDIFTFEDPTIPDSVRRYETTCTLPRKAAEKFTKRQVSQITQLKNEAEWTLPQDYIGTQEGDINVLHDPLNNERLYTRITRFGIGNDFTLECTGRVEKRQTDAGDFLSFANLGDLDSEDDDESADDSEFDTNELDDEESEYKPPTLAVAAFDLPPLDDDQVNKIGMIYGHASIDATGLYISADLYWSTVPGTDPESYWKLAKTQKFSGEAPVGSLLSFFNSFPADEGPQLDTSSTLTISFFQDPALQDASEEQVKFAGENWIAVAGNSASEAEIVGAENVAILPNEAANLAGVTLTYIAPNLLQRDTGSWVADGLQTGMIVNVEETETGATQHPDTNLGSWRISGVSATNLFLNDATTGSTAVFTPETDVDGDLMLVQEVAFKYEFTRLWRGLADTIDHSAVGKSQGTQAMALDLGSVEFAPFGKNKVGQTLYLRSVPLGKTIDEVPEIAVNLEGESIRPHRPRNLMTQRGGTDPDGNSLSANDILVTWFYNPIAPLFDPSSTAEPELPFKKERYRLRWYSDTSYNNFAFQKKLVFDDDEDPPSAMKWWVFKESKQQQFGITPGQGVSLEIWQIGDDEPSKGNVRREVIP